MFAGLADYICPEGGSIDEGIARDAFVETIADLAGAGITDIDALTPGQIQTVFELYATHAIEARICNDIGTKVVTLPADPRAAEASKTFKGPWGAMDQRVLDAFDYWNRNKAGADFVVVDGSSYTNDDELLPDEFATSAGKALAKKFEVDPILWFALEYEEPVAN